MKTKNIKTFLTMAITIAIAGTSSAQVFTGGITGGVSTGAVKIENTGNKFTDVIQGNGIYGYEAGLFAKVNLGPFYIKPMALYTFGTGNVSSSSSPQSTTNFNLYKIETPLMLGLKIIGPLSIEGGPVYNYIIQSTTNFSDNEVSLANSGIGYRVGAAAELGRILLNLSYQGVTYNAMGTDYSKVVFKEPYKLVFGVGIKLGKVKDKD